jgi:hypothetical protein
MAVSYVVSDDQDAISVPVHQGADHEDPVLFSSVDAAFTSISRGEYGEYGTRYILRVDISVAAVAERGWSMTRKEDHGSATGQDQ